MTAALRVATARDASAITDLVNAAFKVEHFFKAGDRTDLDEVRQLLASGEFLVLDAEDGRDLAGCVYLERRGDDGYFGMLSVDPTRQNRGIGRLMIEGVEARCREVGYAGIEIHIVNLREELPPFYRLFGYVETGTLPYPDDGSSTRALHFIVMRKRL